ncbi:MAG: hypothetical protein E7564_11060 [Ruminococcaceae bacterium]|nr:hypothetical protein [Oscillospiraceae bacterium]
MEKKKGGVLNKLSVIISCIAGVMLLILIVYLAFSNNITVKNERDANSVSQVKYYFYRGINDPDAPAGIAAEFKFTPGRLLDTDKYLIFYTVHQYVDVYIDGENIYSLRQGENLKSVITPGSNWVKIPLYREDADKEISIHLTPVYKDAQVNDLDFYLGSEYNIYKNILKKDMPQILISTLSVLMGIVALTLSFYVNVIKKNNIDVAAIGFFAILLGLWRITDISFIHLILSRKTVMLFYVSVSSLMIGSITLLYWMLNRVKNRGKRLLRIGIIAVGLICVIQILLQLFGVCDFHVSLPATHFVIFSSLFAVSCIIIYHNSIKKEKSGIYYENFALILVVLGAVADAVKYYNEGSSSDLFYTLLGFVIFLIISGLSVMLGYKKQEMLIAEKETELTQSRVMTMMSQIRSHFVFNILNAISGMCKYDPQKADMTVVRFSRYLRTNIDIMQEDNLISFYSELRHLEDYVALEQIRFGDKIKFTTEIKENNFLVPPLVIQPVIENSIKHGLTPKPKGGEIKLTTRKENDKIIIEVTDNGVGFDIEALKKEKSVGLKNVMLRLKHMINGEMKIESEIGKGTKTTIIMPFKENLK